MKVADAERTGLQTSITVIGTFVCSRFPTTPRVLMYTSNGDSGNPIAMVGLCLKSKSHSVCCKVVGLF